MRPLAEADAATTGRLELDAPQLGRSGCGKFRLPRRYLLACMACTHAAISYGQRYALALAIVKMQASLDWSRHLQGQVLAAFFLGYMAAQLPAGWIAAKYGPRKVMFVSLLLSSLVNLLLPPAAIASVWLVCTLRVIQGLAQGAVFPGIAALWTCWAPPAERSRCVGLPHPHPRPRPHPHPSFKTTITELLKAMKKQALADGRTGVHTDINHQDKAGKTPLYLAVEHRVPGQTRAIEARACCSAPWATLTHTFHPSPSPFTLTLLPASTLTQPLTLLTVTQALDPTLTLQNQEMIRHLFDKEIVPSNEQPDYLHVNSEGWTIMHAGVFADNVDVLKSVLAHITPQRQM